MNQKKEPQFVNYNAFLDWAAGYILTRFITEGGPGLRGGIVIVINAYVNWQADTKFIKENK
jgi:hypothetical protein